MGTERLGFEDTRILRLESSAIAGHTCKIAVVDPPPDGRTIDVEELRRHVDARLGRAPRCRQRVAFVPLDLARPVWVDYPAFDIREHVRRYGSADAGLVDRERLARIASELMAERLDHARPLWQMDLVGPLEGGGAAIVWRIHHCMADGMTSVRLGEQILWDAEVDPSPPEPDRWRPDPEPSALRLLSAGLGERAAELGRAIPEAGGDVTSPRRWVSAARSARQLSGSLIRELTPLSSASPLDRRIGRRREVAWASRPLDELRGIERGVGKRIAAHVTINDVVLAVISGALRSWLGSAGGRASRLRAQVPVSMHHRGERADALGNRDSFLFVDLPVHEADPVRRVELINSETTARKQAHDAEALYTFFHALGRLGPAGRELVEAASGSPREFSLSVSNVPGPREPVYVLGGRVTQLCSVAEPADRHALRVSALSCAGNMHIGLCTDPDALAGLSVLAAGIHAAVEELGERC